MSYLLGLKRKPLIGMVHCLPLPGTAQFDNNCEEVINQAVSDAEILEKGGCDAIIIENMCDTPLPIKLDIAQKTALSAISMLIKQKVNIPIGIDAAFNDYETSISIAKIIGAQFVRVPVYVDMVAFHGGIIEPCARDVMIYRKNLMATDIKIFADIHVKDTKIVIPSMTLEESALSAENCGADALIVTGKHIGKETSLEDLETIKKLVNIPVLSGSGVNTENINQQLSVADGAIVGTYLKQDRDIYKPIVLEKVQKLSEARN